MNGKYNEGRRLEGKNPISIFLELQREAKRARKVADVVFGLACEELHIAQYLESI